MTTDIYNTDTYNGWTNRETWACNLWLNNDESMYQFVYTEVGSSQELQEWVEGLDDLKSESEILRTMFNDIGSMWRVNWNEIFNGLHED
jgi:hypothetical protein